MVTKPRAIVSLSDTTESINLLVYADSGAGKTVLLGSADTPDTATRALFIATENGTVAAKKQGSTADHWPCKTWADVAKAYNWIEENPDHGYDWLLIDGLTDMQELSMRAALDKAVKINPDRDPDVPAQYEYLKVQQQIKNMVRAFNDLPVHVAYSAQTMRTEDQDDEVLMLPLLTGKQGEFAQKICGLMQVVGYLGVVTPKEEEQEFRRLRTNRRGRIFAKDRYDALGAKVDNPTIPMIQEMIESSIEGGAAKPTAAKRRKKRSA